MLHIHAPVHQYRHDHRSDAGDRYPSPIRKLWRLIDMGIHSHALHFHRARQKRKEVFLGNTPSQLLFRGLFSEQVLMLLRSEGIDFAAPESELTTSDILIDFERNVIYHVARFAADLVAILDEIFSTESLDRK